jgi:hypothetical protein
MAFMHVIPRFIIMCAMMSLSDTTALVRFIVEEDGAAAAFLVDNDRGKLLQYSLIHVRCTKKITRVPVSTVPQYGYSV